WPGTRSVLGFMGTTWGSCGSRRAHDLTCAAYSIGVYEGETNGNEEDVQVVDPALASSGVGTSHHDGGSTPGLRTASSVRGESGFANVHDGSGGRSAGHRYVGRDQRVAAACADDLQPVGDAGSDDEPAGQEEVRGEVPLPPRAADQSRQPQAHRGDD